MFVLLGEKTRFISTWHIFLMHALDIFLSTDTEAYKCLIILNY